MHHLYLRAESEQALWDALTVAGLTEPSEEGVRFTGVALDIIGTIYQPTGVMLTDDDGHEYPEMAAVDGYHANLITDRPHSALPTIPTPATPYRVWAGQ